MSPSADDIRGTSTLDERLREGRPQLGDALAGLRDRVVASVVGKPPSKVGRYELGRTIGSGSFGTVFEAYDAELDRRVAVKIVAVRSAIEASRVVREAQLLASLSHPNVVSVFEAGVTDDDPPSPYLVMELVEGQTVREWVAQEPRPWREVVEVMLQAARGLEAAHRAGIIHRDFKPDNALRGVDGRVRVLDFGLARTADDAEVTTISASRLLASDAPLRTPTGGILGTPAYMAPEAFTGEVTPRADQYSLSVSLYEVLFGQRPISASTIDELTTRLRHEEPSLPDDRRGVPSAITAVLLRGLAREPEARFGDLGQWVVAMEAGLRPRRSAWWLGAAAGAAGVLAAVIALGSPGSAEPAPAVLANEVPEAPATPPVDPSLASVLAELGDQTATLRTLVSTSKLDAALELSQSLVERARAIDHPPTLVDLLLLRGQAMSRATDYEHAIPVIEEAYFLARDHDLPRPMAHAASELVGLWGYQADEYEKAHRWKGHAEVAFERAGLDPREHPPYMSSIAGLMSREGDIPGAIEVLREAVRNIEASDQAGTSVHAAMLRQLATELYVSKDVEAAIEVHREAIPMFAANDGTRSPTYARAVDNLGVFFTALGRYEEALAQHQEALEIREAVLDPGHIDLPRSHGNLGRTYGLLGREAEALRHIDRSIELFTARLGAGNAAVGMGHEHKGEVYARRGLRGREQALAEYDKAARIYDGAGVIYAPTAERVRKAIEALGGTPPPRPSVSIPPEL